MLGYTSNQFQFRLLAWSELFNKAAYFRDFQNQQLEPSEIFSVHMAENHAMGRFYILVQGWIQAMLGIPTCTFWTNCFSTGEAFWMFRIRFPAFLKMEYLEKPNQKMWGSPTLPTNFYIDIVVGYFQKKFPSAGINSSIFIGRNTPPKSIPNGYLWKRDEIFEWNVSSSNYHFVSKRTCLIFPVAGDFFFWNMLSLVVVEEPLKVIVWLPWVIGAAKCPCGNFRRVEDVGSAGAPWTPSVPGNESLISTWWGS